MKTLAALFCLLAFPAWAQGVLTNGNQCNGTFTGVFAGDIHVSPGQVCGFENGRITGSVFVNGGSGQVNTAIDLYSTEVDGSLIIDHTAPLPSIYANEICASIVKGMTRITNNAGSTLIGPSYKQYCPGNTFVGPAVVKSNGDEIQFRDNSFGSSLWVINNPGVLYIIYNTIAGDLVCRGNNPGLQAWGNKAHRIVGRCGPGR
jgi:hypothetical protein